MSVFTPPAPSLAPVAVWPDRAWLGRGVKRLACRHLLRLHVHMPRPPGDLELEQRDALFVYFAPGSLRADAALGIELPGRRTGQAVIVSWLALRGELDRSLVCRRVQWWLHNEVRWRPGSVLLPKRLAPVLRTGECGEGWVPNDPMAWGSSVLDPEPYQLLEVPPPVVWPLLKFECAAAQPR